MGWLMVEGVLEGKRAAWNRGVHGHRRQTGRDAGRPISATRVPLGALSRSELDTPGRYERARSSGHRNCGHIVGKPSGNIDLDRALAEIGIRSRRGSPIRLREKLPAQFRRQFVVPSGGEKKGFVDSGADPFGSLLQLLAAGSCRHRPLMGAPMGPVR